MSSTRAISRANASRYDGAYLNDAVDNISDAFIGMTVACARCHDHKFDPVPASYYYAIYGIIESTKFPDPGDDVSRRQIGFVYRDPKSADRQDIKEFNTQLKPIAGAINAVFALPGTYDDILPQLEARRMNLYAHAPVFPENAYAVTDGPVQQAQVQVHGDPTNLGDPSVAWTRRRCIGRGLGAVALSPWLSGCRSANSKTSSLRLAGCPMSSTPISLWPKPVATSRRSQSAKDLAGWPERSTAGD